MSHPTPVGADGTFPVNLTGWRPGLHTILMAAYADENAATPAVKAVSYRVKG